MASHLVTSELEWPFIFELWPRVPNKWYNILPFIPSSSQSRLNFAPEAFHRNVVQQALSFDLLKYQDGLRSTKKSGAFFGSILSGFYLCLWLNTSCEGLQRSRLIARLKTSRKWKKSVSRCKRGGSTTDWISLENRLFCFTTRTLRALFSNLPAGEYSENEQIE